MPPRFDIGALKRDPRTPWKYVLAILALANVAAFFLLVRPLSGSTDDLIQQLSDLRMQAKREQTQLIRMRSLVKKVEKARAEQEQFFKGYFMDRRTTASTILIEIGDDAKAAQLSVKEHSFQLEPVEGSDTISMLTITANYEGSYGDLVRFVNLIDRSARFLIIDNIQATPLQSSGRLSARFKMNTFIREEKKQ
jgi:type IV pilus assembly protein PilO